MLSVVLNSLHKTRRTTLPLTVGLLVLIVAVFGWGLHYKMSLYRSKHTIGHHWQPATLLTERERPLALQGGVHHEPESFTAVRLIFLPLLFLALDLLIPGKLRMCYARLQSRRSWLLCLKARFSPFFFRPPPTVLSL